jgi:hypothetical protein
MALKGLNEFQKLDVEKFFSGKTMVFVKATSWEEGDEGQRATLGSKVIIQITKDGTKYAKAGIDNFGEQLTIKVRGVDFNTYAQQFKPLVTEVVVTDIEKAVIWGEYRNQISVTAVVKAKESTAQPKATGFAKNT